MSAAAEVIVQRLLIASIEVVVLALIVFALIRVARIKQPRVRAIMWSAVIAKPVLTLLFGAVVPVTMPDFIPPTPTLVNIELTVDDKAPLANIDKSTDWIPARTASAAGVVTLIAAGLWLAGVLVAFGRVLAGRLRLRRFLADALPPSGDIARAYARIVAEVGVHKAPAIVVSARIDSPAIVGTVRPTVVLPKWMAAEGVTEHMQWSMRHELTHWRLRDPWFAQLVEISRCLFFFHPVVFFIAKSWRDNSEMACDRELVVSDHDAREYAEHLYHMLLKVRSHRRTALAGSLYASRSQIGRRIEALLGDSAKPRRRTIVALALLSIVVLSVGADWPARETGGHDVYIMERQAGGESEHVRGYRCVHKSDDTEKSLYIEGEIDFTADYTAIAQIGPNAWMELVDDSGDLTKRLLVTPDEHGNARYDFTIGDRATEFDDATRTWMQERVKACVGTKLTMDGVI